MKSPFNLRCDSREFLLKDLETSRRLAKRIEVDDNKLWSQTPDAPVKLYKPLKATKLPLSALFSFGRAILP